MQCFSDSHELVHVVAKKNQHVFSIQNHESASPMHAMWSIMQEQELT